MHNIGNGSNNRTIVYDGKIAGLYDLEETLGSGHFAVVKLARHVFTGEKVAVKVIDKTKLDEVSKSHLFQEVRCMKLVQHPNVVRLYEVIDTQTKLYLILELGDGGDLYDYIMKHEGGLSENLAREYFRQIVRAISYCHKLHVVHRDLKPENVVFFEKLGVVKLTDFGFSNKFNPGQKLETSCGSLAYSAPEILLGDSYDAPAVDIWSLGVILYMLVCGNPPFEKANDSETLTMIMDCKYTMPPHVSQSCRKLIDSMLVRAPEKRATLEQIAQDPWLIENVNSSIQQQEDTNLPELIPLVGRQQVSDDDHTIIIKKMVNGNIATKEEILDALDRNEYNHITATYFLMAERKLRQQRLDQIQKRRPDLSLPVTTNSQLSPRSRIQGIKNMQSNRDANNQLLVPTSNQINAPRTPGAETTSGGRTRKCSIVQEEEDDEDEIPNCTKRDELMAPINRRGSRSEGRINLAIQDKVVQNNERIKNNNYLGQKGIENISGIKVINNDTNNIRMRLGQAGGSTTNNNIGNHNQNRLINPAPPIELTKTNCKELNELKQNESTIISGINRIIINEPSTNEIDTKYLIDSSTITLPITSNTISNDSHKNVIPKYKTMPSPTRPNIILSGPRQLNEIFEEGTDIGSSDTSTTTTPRPVTRSAHFTTTNRGNSSSGSGINNSSVVGHHHHHHRRTKFHKNRTPSCSSSDASDDDSESRKKRAHKMPDIIKPLKSQRRDSHDDSSDSQEPGNNPSTSNTNAAVSYLLCTTTGGGGGDNGSGSGRNRNENGGTSSNNKNGGTGRSETIIDNIESENINNWNEDIFNSNEKTEQQQQLNYRRHRNGRRRASETRLRESQSLNRITEVQESEMPMNYNNINNHNSQSTSNANQNNSTILTNDTEMIESVITIESDNQNSIKTIPTIIKNSKHPPQTNIQQPQLTTTKSKGFSARLFQGFIRNKNHDSKNINTIQQQQQLQQPQITTDSHSADDVDVVLGVEFTKSIRLNESASTKTSSATKKLKMLGKYFQVHKKICIPLPGLFQRAAGGRLYKAQSCGSIVHNRLNQNTLNSTTTTPSTIQNSSLLNSRHSVLYTTTTTTTSSIADKPISTTTNNIKYIKNKSLGGSRFLNNSDSDINQNNDNCCRTTTTTTATANINNLSNCNNISTVSSLSSSNSSPIQSNHHQQQLLTSSLIFSNADIQLNQINEFKPSTFNLMSSTSSTMATTLLAAQNNTSNNLLNNSKITSSPSSSSTTTSKSSSPLHHQLNDVPLCSSKC